MFIMKIDGVTVDISGYENIVFLNINYWGGGVTQLWKADPKVFKKDSFGDGIIQVIGLSDVLHMGQVQVGMDEPFPIGQGKIIELTSKVDNKIIPLQIDGQPIQLITPFQIVIERKDQINVLATTPSDNGKIMSFLREGLKEKIIS